MDEWEFRAACRRHPSPDWWFSARLDSDETALAKQICFGCPVRTLCATRAADTGERVGVVGGFHTRFDTEWAALHSMLGRRIPPRGARVRSKGQLGGTAQQKYVVTCACSTVFETKDSQRRKCPTCRLDLVPAAPTQALIAQARAEYGISYADLGALMGISRQQACEIATKAGRVKRATAEKVEAVLGRSMARSA